MTQEEYERRANEFRKQIAAATQASASRPPYREREAYMEAITPESEARAKALNTPIAKASRYIRGMAEEAPEAINKVLRKVKKADEDATEYTLRALDQIPKSLIQGVLEIPPKLGDPETTFYLKPKEFILGEKARRKKVLEDNEAKKAARKAWNPLTPEPLWEAPYARDAIKRIGDKVISILSSPEATGDAAASFLTRRLTKGSLKDTPLDEIALTSKTAYELFEKDYAQHPQSWEALWEDFINTPAKTKQAIDDARKRAIKKRYRY